MPEKARPASAFGKRLAFLGQARGLAQVQAVADNPARRNTRLLRRPREIEKLPASDRRAVIELVDGLLARQKLNSRGTRQ